MKSEEEDIELIEGYVRLTLSPSQRKEVEQRLVEDPGFAEMYDDYRAILSGIYQEGERSFEEEMKAWDREIADPDKRRVRNQRFAYWWAAAAVLVIMLTGTYFLTSRQNTNMADLAAETFEPYPDVITIRGAQSQANNGMEAYSNNSYDVAITSFQDWLREHPDDATIRFYLGCAQVATAQYEDAARTFEAIPGDSNAFKDQTEWYLSLAYLGSGQTEEATRLLQTISSTDGHDYSPSARTLLEKL